MIALLQRVSKASVRTDGATVAEIGSGLAILLGVFDDDTEHDAVFLADKCVNLRIFEDNAGAMNLSLLEVGGEVLIVSQFTLCANSRKGRRPSFARAMEPKGANKLYEIFCERLAGHGSPVKKGLFGARMLVEIANDGPVTIILNSRETRRLNIKKRFDG